ncbi:MAG: metal ABC transporter permease [Planctomycetota bacterium]
MCADGWLLAAGATELITWQERLLMPLTEHAVQLTCTMLIGAVLGLLGCFVVLRRMALIGDAISHAVLPGVVVAFLMGHTGLGGLFGGALAAGVLTAVSINLLGRCSRAREDSTIGIVFTAMFALGIVLISRLPAGTHFDLKCFLFGDPLAIQRTDLLSIATIAPLVTIAVIVLFHPLKLVSFDPLLARTMGFNTTAIHYVLMIMLSATIVAALRSVGVIMAVAMLITPAALAYQLCNRLWTMLVLASLTGALAAGAGMFVAFVTNDPPGAVMVLVATVLFLLAVVFAPERGLLTAWLRRRQIHRHIVEEDLLKALAQRDEERLAAGGAVAALPSATTRQVRAALARLVRSGLASGDVARITLTDAGRRRALEMVRAHRLWETYLAEQHVGRDQVHAEAERLEHAHEVAEELADSLGNPQADPHGSPIPPRP